MSPAKFSVADLPVDVFELETGDLEIESLTGGHGMLEHGASRNCGCSCRLVGCSCCSASPKSPR
ncbi:thiomuracin/GE37468 family thiazolyl RiPP peptide [Nonomuraea sp. NPDC004580]|uniref:thiomuracin/GE37468 family thiazolyl RiPP peptide n=1 Tax=Nonomuraea sp. NPDC004580 TaxID=3154552 RepID=UPI0033B5DC87